MRDPDRSSCSFRSIPSLIAVDEALKLPYLQACINEVLRIFPPVAPLRERITPPEGDFLREFFIPGGVNVGFNLRAMQRNKVFGSDPKVFHPKRWLEQDKERIAEMNKVHSIIHSYGGSKSLGKGGPGSVAWVRGPFGLSPRPTMTLGKKTRSGGPSCTSIFAGS